MVECQRLKQIDFSMNLIPFNQLFIIYSLIVSTTFSNIFWRCQSAIRIKPNQPKILHRSMENRQKKTTKQIDVVRNRSQSG